MEFNTELITATLKDYSVVQNLARFYAYDMSRYCSQAYEGWEFPENGLYECADFKKYLAGKGKHAYLVRINSELAGFVFVNQLEIMPEVNWNMAEFYIVAKFQRSGIGAKIAKEVFTRFKGEWSVGVIPQNTRALLFWRKVIAEYTDNCFDEIEKNSAQLRTAEHPCPFPMIIFRFKSEGQKKL